MRGENSRNISPKQEKHQRNVMRGETEAIRRGEALYTNSVNTRILASRDDDATGHDDERAVGKRAQKDNSTDDRVLASGPTDPQRAVGPEHQKDDSTNTRVLASKEHLETPEGENNLNLNDQRAVGPDAVKARGLRTYHFPDNEIAGAKIFQLKDKDKLPDLQDHNGALRHAQVQVPRKRSEGGGTQSLQDSYLKTTTNAAFLKHTNAHHDPEFQAKDAPKSIPIHRLPAGTLYNMVQMRAKLRQHRRTLEALDSRTPTEQMRLDTIIGLLHVMHATYNTPEMTLEAMTQKILDSGDSYRDIAAEQQTMPAPVNAYYFSHGGVDTYSTDESQGPPKSVDSPWYPPKTVSLSKASDPIITGAESRTFRVNFTSKRGEQDANLVLIVTKANVPDITGEFRSLSDSNGTPTWRDFDYHTPAHGNFKVLAFTTTAFKDTFSARVSGTDPFIVYGCTVSHGENPTFVAPKRVAFSSGTPEKPYATSSSEGLLNYEYPKGYLLDAYVLEGDYRGADIVSDPSMSLFSEIFSGGVTLALFGKNTESSEKNPQRTLDLGDLPVPAWASTSLTFMPRRQTTAS